MVKTAFISHLDCDLHDMGAYHPESPVRLQAIRSHLAETGLFDDLHVTHATPVADEPLLRVHPAAHIQRIRDASPEEGRVQLDADTAICPDSLRAAQLAAGAMVQAVDGVSAGEFNRAFCAVRPPGHHAEQDVSMGFCLFNNVAVGVRHAMQVHAATRVAVLDFDVHHGNGTVDIFQNDPNVLVCSSFQHPFYPGRYSDFVAANIVNTPLAAGTGGDAFRRAIERDWLPALEQHQPEWFFVSAGFDAHRADPLAQLDLVEDDYHWVTQLISDAADAYADGRVVSILEGGYDPKALARSVHAHVATLMG